MSLFEYIQQGGTIMYILVLLNIIGFAMMITKFWLFSKESKATGELSNEISSRLKQGNDQKDSQTMIELAKQEIAVYISQIEKGLNTVRIIAGISPLLGLLGTVIGVLLAFQVMASQGLNDPSFFAKGISMALVTTVGGMIVAIPHFIGHNYLMGMVDSLEAKLEKEVISKIL